MPGYELIDWKEKKALKEIFDQGSIFFAHGFDKVRKKYHVREFEAACEIFFKSKYCLFVSSGTAAIKIGLKALNVGPGDHVLTQSFNFIATIEAILDVGAIPKIIKIDDSLNMCPEDLKKNITKRTKAVIPVHMLGFSADLDSIKKTCKKQKIPILEDNCEAIGGSYKNRYLGCFSDVGVFSFDFGKIITTGEGGMILTDNKKIYEYCKEYHDHGHQNLKNISRGNDQARISGFNYRATEFQGAVGKVQLKKLKILLKDNKQKYLIIDKYLNKKFEIRKIHKNSQPNFDTYIFFVKNSKKRRDIVSLLHNLNIGTKNLPDAIKWHCSYYWKHCLPESQIKRSFSTKEKLEECIAIPINYKISLNRYKDLCKKILQIK
jgi:8-amino-3,8-dideoxy-alpha-D-manno-octulosonate transaminase